MRPLRPCTCDRFIAGRPFVEGRDCPRCWMFAHRPSVRQAWGGDPADCAPLLSGRPDMTAAELADLLDGPPVVMPEGWRHWPVTREAHLLLAERFLASMPAYPEGRFAGRGAVLCGGGDYEASAYVCCRMLRHVGWPHPIQVWHRGPAEPVSSRLRRLPGVEVVDAEAHPARRARRLLGGWESKMFAALNSPFEEVLFLDADCYPIYDPDECFEPANNPHGIVTWPDTPGGDHNPQWACYGLEPDGQPAISGGYYVLSKRRAWPVMQLAAHYDDHSDYYYCRTWGCVGDVGGFGDQDQVRVALHRLRAPSLRYAERPLLCAYESYIHAGPGGRPLFVHRHYNKFALPGRFSMPPRWYGGELPMEATAWRYFLEWLTTPGDDPPEAPGAFTPAESELWRRCCAGRDVLELGRHHGRNTVAAAQSARRVVSLNPRSPREAELWLERHGVRHKVWLREGPFAELMASSGGPFSACLIDGLRDRATVEADVAAVAGHLRPAALVGFHDSTEPGYPAVQPAADAAARRHGWEPVERAGRLSVFRTPGPGPGAGGELL